MARRRMVDPEFWSDEGITSLPLGARLLAIGILNFSDDRGVFPDSPKKVRNLVFPGDTFPTEDIVSWLNGLVDIHYLYRFTHTGIPFLKVRNWTKYQHIVNPSDKGFIPKDATIPIPEYNSPSIGVDKEDDSPSIPLVPEGKLSKDSISKDSISKSTAAAKKRKPTFTTLEKPQDLLALFSEDELTEACRLFPAAKLDWEAGKCLDWHNARGGSGNWKLAFKNWLGNTSSAEANKGTPHENLTGSLDPNKYTQGKYGHLVKTGNDGFAYQDQLAEWRKTHPEEPEYLFRQSFFDQLKRQPTTSAS